VPPITELQHSSVGLTTTAGDANGIDPGLVPSVGTGVVEAPVAAVRDDHDEIFSFVEIPPSFPGGEAALARYLGDHIRYPQLASETGVSGIVFIQFVVDYEGNVKDVKPIGTRKGAGLEEEATRVIKSMPKWKPGRQNGRNVSVYFNLPIRFEMNN
jgi:protein TonB